MIRQIATVIVAAIIASPAVAQQRQTPEPRLPAKDCVVEASIQKQIAEQQKILLQSLPTLEAMGRARQQCREWFGEDFRCEKLGDHDGSEDVAGGIAE